nr:glycosyltransferase family 9 protein [Polynucleobacter paneuropaeus]
MSLLQKTFYSQSVQVPTQCHAVDRSRWVMCSAMDLPLVTRETKPQFYPQSFVEQIPNSQIFGLHRPYILCFHSTARAAKRWSKEHWVALGKALASDGYQIVFPWGNAEERVISEALAVEVTHSLVPPAFSIDEAFSLIKGADLTIGVDTGLTHLAAALDRPTVEIYCDSPLWKTEGYWSKRIRNVGDIEAPPSVAEVLAASRDLLKNSLRH